MERLGHLRRLLAVFVALAMVLALVGSMSGAALANALGQKEKFQVKVSSVNSDQETKAVTGTVFDNYNAEFVIDKGNVNSSNVRFDVSMQDVASLGVTGKRTHPVELKLADQGQDVNLQTVASTFAPLNNTRVVGTVGDKSVTYTISASDNNYKYTATPNAYQDASDVWHAIVNEDNIVAGTQSANNSYAIIANGSSLKTGTSVLEFESATSGDLRLDNIGKVSDLNSTIRKAVKLRADGEDLGNKLVIDLKAGTTLAIGQSLASLKRDATITLSGEGISSATLQNDLVKLQKLGSNNETYGDILFAAYDILKDTVNMVGGRVLNVGFSFAENPAADYKFRMMVSSQSQDSGMGAVTASVYPDYRAEIAYAGTDVNPSNLGVDFWMQNVASLGVDGIRHYGQSFETGIEYKDVSLNIVKTMFGSLESSDTKVVGVVDGKRVEYSFEPGENDALVATPDAQDNARDVWHAIVNEKNIQSGYNASNDSYVSIPNGSYLQADGKKLEFESSDAEALRIDKIADMKALEAKIRAAVKLSTVDSDEIIAFLKPGTTLAMGTSYAVLLEEAKITVTGNDDLGIAIGNALESLRSANGVKELIGNGIVSLGTAMEVLAGKTTTVNFEFGHQYGEPNWTWAEDCSSATAEFVCAECGEAKKVSATIASETTAATCEEAGKTVYTATATFDGKAYTDTKEVVIAALGHDWGEPAWTWADDNSSATATFTCANDAAHAEDATATIAAVEGRDITYTATVEFNGKTYTDTRHGSIDSNLKFRMKVSSETAANGTGSVTGTVHNDYTADIKYAGDYVSPSNATVAFWMQNVASLGVDGTRYYAKPVQTGIADSNISMETVKMLFSGLEGKSTKLVGKIGDKQVEYTVTANDDGVNAEPASQEAASAVWHAIVNSENMTSTVVDKSDSYALIANGSYLQAGGKKLMFETEGDLEVNNVDDVKGLNSEVRNKVKLIDAKDTSIVAYLEEGTKLAMGTSVVTLDKEVKIAVAADKALGEALAGTLVELRDADNAGALIKAVVFGFGNALSSVAGKTTTVEFTFGHQYDEGVVTTPATCTEPGVMTYTCANNPKHTKTEPIPALGHKYGEPVWSWNEDATEAAARFACENDANHVETVEAVITTEIKGADETRTATVTFDEKTYTDEKHFVNKEELNKTLASAEDAEVNVSYHEGADIAVDSQWTDAKALKALAVAIARATDVAENDDATVDQVNAATEALKAALSAYDSAKQPGTKTDASAESVDKSKLAAALAAAQADALAAAVSSDGTDVDPADRWSTADALAAFNEAVAAAEAVLADEAATKDQVADALVDLKEAHRAFDDAKRAGTKAAETQQPAANEPATTDTPALQPATPAAGEQTTISDTATPTSPAATDEDEGTMVIDENETALSAAKITKLGVGATEAQVEAMITALKSDGDPAGSTFGTIRAKSTKATTKSVKLTWKKVKKAKKYVIYGNKCGKKNKFKKVKTIKKASKVSYNFKKVAGKKVKKNASYKFIVVAFDKNGKMLTASKVVHVKTKAKKTNYKKVTIKKAAKVKNTKKATLKAKKTLTLKVKLTKIAAKKKVNVHRTVRFESSNPKVAKVGAKTGKVTAKKKGTATIYAYAQNGVYATFKVTVK